MKKLTILFASMLLVLFTSVTTSSCSKDDDNDAKSCTELATEVSDAAADFAANMNATTCNAYKTAINAYLDGCDDITEDQIAAYEAALALLDCDAL
jgi:hypothetical protein